MDLPVPRDWQVFEDFCRDLFAAEWGDPNTQRHGRSGQNQKGVDVYGRRGQLWQAVQCKKRQVFPEKDLTEAEIRAEVEAAKTFDQDLKTLIVATTAPPDTKLQALARSLTKEMEADDLFEVVIYGWSQLCELLSNHPREDRKWRKLLALETHGIGHRGKGYPAVGHGEQSYPGKILPPEIAKQRQAALLADLQGLLESSRPAAKAIAGQVPEWEEAFLESGVPALLELIMDSADVYEVLCALDRAHGLLSTAKEARERDTGVVEDIVWHLGPLMVQNGLLQSLPKVTRGIALELPLSTCTVAELALAAYDGGPSRLQPKEGDDPEGVGRLPLPAEVGIDVGDGAMLASYGEHLEQQFLTPNARRTLNRIRKNPDHGEAEARERAFELVDRFFRHEMRDEARPRRRYLLFDNLFAEDNGPFLQALDERLRTVHLVELTGLDIVRDEPLSWPITSILQRCAELRGKKGQP